MKLSFYYLAIVLFLAGLTTSCENYKAKLDEEVQRQRLLDEQLKSLVEEEKLIKGEYADALSTLNEINSTLDEMAARNQEMDKLIQQKELAQGTSNEQVIMAKLLSLKNANIEADQKAKKLRSKAKAFKVENEELKKMVAQLENKFTEVEAEVTKVQSTIANMQIALKKLEDEVSTTDTKLASAYAELKVKTYKLERSNEELEVTLADLQSKNTFIEEDAKAYIACGTKVVLRRNDILKLLSDKALVPGYQTQVKKVGSPMNYFNEDIIDCGDGLIQYLLPNRDPNSYKIEGAKVTVLDRKTFWATGKTVVLVKK